MLLGVKSYDNKDFFEHFKDSADFFEVQAIESKDYSFLESFKLPFVVHAEHLGFGINIADKKLEKKNINAIKFAIKIADLAKAKKIIVHPGKMLNPDCLMKQSIKILDIIDDDRIIIENLPSLSNGLCDTPENTKIFLDRSGKRLILDINHAIETAVLNNLDYINYLKSFIRLKPKHYHFGGQIIHNKDYKTHLSFRESNIDHENIMKIIPKSAEMTLEVTTNIKKTEYDLAFIRDIIRNQSG